VEKIDCLVPAAGRSLRMGDWKPALPFGGATIVQCVVRTALEWCARVVLVAGYRGEELAALFAGEPRVRVAANPRWEAGMFSSLQAGAAAVSTVRFFICPADMPLIRPECYRALLDAAGGEVVLPVFAGRRGHPVLLDAALLPEIRTADPGSGRMKDIIARHRVTEVPWGDDTILRDIDTREDYRP
jgi:molybdenum cofactor cytidylyltransferase